MAYFHEESGSTSKKYAAQFFAATEKIKREKQNGKNHIYGQNMNCYDKIKHCTSWKTNKRAIVAKIFKYETEKE